MILDALEVNMSTDSAEPSDRVEAESTVTESFGTTIPSEVRSALREGLEPGDKVRWAVEDGEVSVDIVRERYGTLSEAGPYEGEPTNAVEATEEPGRFD